MHAFRGITRRNRSLFLPHGHAYVYLCYGTSMMLNVSSEAEGVGAGVLIRALEPVAGIPLMAALRRGSALEQVRGSALEQVRGSALGQGRGSALEQVRGSALEHGRGSVPLRDLARGPGRLAAALSIDLALDGVDLCNAGPLHLAEDDAALDGEVAVSRRIGITKAADRLLRFYLRGSQFVQRTGASVGRAIPAVSPGTSRLRPARC